MNQELKNVLSRNLEKAIKRKQERNADVKEKYAWVKPIADELREVFGGFHSLTLYDDGKLIGRWKDGH